jgi:hypothetical protein
MIRISSGIALFLIAATVKTAMVIGTPEALYYQSAQNKLNPSLDSKYCVENTAGWDMDACLCPMKINDTTMGFFLSSWNGIDKYHGPLTDPLNTRDWGHYYTPDSPPAHAKIDTFPLTAMWSNTTQIYYHEPVYAHTVPSNVKPSRYETGTSGADSFINCQIYLWIESIYKVPSGIQIPGVSAGDILGFVHIEQSATWKDHFYEDCIYTIGLAYSKNGGVTWTYCGEIIRQNTFRDTRSIVWRSKDNGGQLPGYPLLNIGGCPYITRGDYFYIYFSEWNSKYAGWITCVARAKKTDVLKTAAAAALNNRSVFGPGTPSTNLTAWRKYYNKTWGEPGTGGAGDNVIKTFPVNISHTVGTHSSATFCRYNKNYLLTVTGSRTNGSNVLLLYSSTNGISWKNPLIIDTDSSKSFQYSCFVSLKRDATDDCHIVGKEFYIFYPHFTSATEKDLYRVKVRVY